MANFFHSLYPEQTDFWLTLWTLDDKATHWFQDFSQAHTEALKLAKRTDVYFGVGLRRKKLTPGYRGSNRDIAVLPGLWMDIDVSAGVHANNKLPQSTEEARELLGRFPLPPTILIHSGYGLHGYWLFKEPLELESEAERTEASGLLQRFQFTIRETAREHGWKLDNTSDLARVLRVPGTYNYKQKKNPVEVIVLEQKEHRYNPDDFEEYLLDTADINASNLEAEFSTPAGKAELMIDNCRFIQHCRDNATRLAEPEWYAMITNLARAEDGHELVHKFSKPYPSYSKKETDEKIEHALTNGFPHTCKYIKESLQFENCGECRVTAPISWAISQVAQAQGKVVNIGEMDSSLIFTDDVIDALAVIRKEDPTRYAGIKSELKGKVSMHDLERAVKWRIAERQKMRLARPQEEANIENILPNIPMKEAKIPKEWAWNQNGIWLQRLTKEGQVEFFCACPVPLMLTKRLRDVDSGKEKVELAFYRDEEWHFMTAHRSNVFHRQNIVNLSNLGLPVSSESSGTLVRFLDDFERENLETIPTEESISRMGWVGKDRFIPGNSDGIRLDVEPGSGEAIIASAYREQGDLKDWVKVAREVRKFPVARFMLSASFAAPLMNILNHRVVILHSWGATRSGKTAALKSALSVWGDPEKLMTSFNATKVGMERLASFYSDLPLGIDERQVIGDQQWLLDSLIYSLSMGQGKARGAKHGGLQSSSSWRTIVLTTGEHPLAEESSAGGISSRILELYGVPIDDEVLAKKLHDETRMFFGSAGPEYIKNLIGTERTEVQQVYEGFLAQVNKTEGEHSAHSSTLAMVLTADYYSSRWIFDRSHEDALCGVDWLLANIAPKMEDTISTDEGRRAYDYIMGWAGMHQNAFSNESFGERKGFIQGDYIMIYRPAFDEAIKKGGYNSRRTLRAWQEKGVIKTQKSGNKTQYTYKVRDPADGNRAIRMVVLWKKGYYDPSSLAPD